MNKDSGNVKWILFFSLVLCASSAVVYYLQVLIFRNPRDTFFYLFQDLAFLPVQVLLVTLFLNELMSRREKKSLLGKMNMVIGVFFSEVGNRLLTCLAEFDDGLEAIRERLEISAATSEKDFRNIRAAIAGHRPEIAHKAESAKRLKEFLISKHGFLASLLENQNLLEHERFTDMLWAIFHLMEELEYREDLDLLPETDRRHLAGDIARAYEKVLKEWLSYVEHLKSNYPFIYSLVVRTNPFNSLPSPVIYS